MKIKGCHLIILVFIAMIKGTFSQCLDFYNEAPDSAEIFLPEVISIENRWEYCVSMVPNSSRLVYTAKQGDDVARVYAIEETNGKWMEPFELPLVLDTANSYAMEAFPSLDGKKLYYTVCDSIGCDIWYIPLDENSWGEPEKLNSDLNDDVVFYSTFMENGDMFYTNVSKMKTYVASYNEGRFEEFKEAGFGGAHAYPSKDGSFVLVNSKGEYGGSDIFVYFKNEDNSWSKPVNLGDVVNTSCSESCPSLSLDRKVLFFNRYCKETDAYDLYWIKADFIVNLKP